MHPNWLLMHSGYAGSLQCFDCGKIVLGDFHSAQADIDQHGMVGINIPIMSATETALSSLRKGKVLGYVCNTNSLRRERDSALCCHASGMPSHLPSDNSNLMMCNAILYIQVLH